MKPKVYTSEGEDARLPAGVHSVEEYGLNLEEDIATANVSHAGGVKVYAPILNRCTNIMKRGLCSTCEKS